MITYEYPLNERVRTLLRLEDLYDRVHFFLQHESPHDHHACLNGIFEILEVAGRADLKSDLLQELDRQRTFLDALRANPAISEEKLDQILAEIDRAFTNLHGLSGKSGQSLRENEWLMAIKQRAGIPGGTSEFDLPSYHYWMHRPVEERRADLLGWIRSIDPVHAALSIVLRVLRESAPHHLAGGGPGRLPAGSGRKARAAAAPHAFPVARLRARDQRQQVRAEHPLPRSRGRAEKPGVRARRGFRSFLLQPVTREPERAVRLVACPGCGARVAYSPSNPWRPFCSERCRQTDLGAWASEAYRIPLSAETTRTPLPTAATKATGRGLDAPKK